MILYLKKSFLKVVCLGAKKHITALKLYCFNCLSSLLLHKKINPDSFRFRRSHDKPPKLPPRDSALYGGGVGGHPASTFSQASASNSIWAQVKGGGNKGKGTGGGKRPGGFNVRNWAEFSFTRVFSCENGKKYFDHFLLRIRPLTSFFIKKGMPPVFCTFCRRETAEYLLNLLRYLPQGSRWKKNRK